MARTPADRSRSTQPSLRDHLAEVPAFLKPETPPHIKEAIGAVLSPGGWERLRATDPARDEGSKNLAVQMPVSIRDQIRAAHAKDESKVSLTAKANEGLVAYLEGRFSPLVRPPRNLAEPEAWVNLNVTASALLQRQVKERVRQDPNVSDPRKGAAWVTAEWLMSEYGIGPYAESARPVLPKGAQRNVELPRRVRDLIREQSATVGDRVDDIVNEGFQKFLDGNFDAQPVAWPEQDAADMVVLRIHPADELVDKVRQACKGKPGLGALSGPNRVALDYLLDQFGIDPEAPAE